MFVYLSKRNKSILHRIGGGIFIQIHEMTHRLKETVADYRYEHALLVADTAVHIATRFGVDAHQAQIAGLLHDCAKGFTDDPEPMLSLAAEAGYIANPTELLDPVAFLHAPLSAYVARRDYDVDDTQILQAIARHMCVQPNMTKLDKIIYLADSTEPTRRGMESYRQLLQEDMEEAFFQLYQHNLSKVICNGWFFASNASDVYNSILLERRQSEGNPQR